jgi:hypothetical protein
VAARANQVAAMGADVGEAVDLIVVVASQEERLFDARFENEQGWTLPGALLTSASAKLPGTREGVLLHRAKISGDV